MSVGISNGAFRETAAVHHAGVRGRPHPIFRVMEPPVKWAEGIFSFMEPPDFQSHGANSDAWRSD